MQTNHYYAQKLDHIDQYLLACGWTKASDYSGPSTRFPQVCFVPPNSLIDETGAEQNRGCAFVRATAIMIQVQYDEACKAMLEEEVSKAKEPSWKDYEMEDEGYGKR